MAVDLGRMFIAKNETQAYCDAAALAAALALNGASSGITAAQNAVANTKNAWNLDSAYITNYQVAFATGVGGPWDGNPNPAAGYTYARVQATVPLQLYFLSVIAGQYTQNVSSVGIAAQIAQTSFSRGLAPYTVVGSDPSSPAFGLAVGDQYDIQWPQYNGTRAGCGPGNPDKCFVSPPCSGDPKAARSAVTQYWGASINGYWGSNSNSVINQEVLDVIQLQSVSVGDSITLSTGDKNSEAKALDLRVNEDQDILDNTVDSYINSSNHNGRRLVALPVVNPTSSGTFVLGYGGFLLLSNSTAKSPGPSTLYASGNGNDPFCAIYIGPYTQGSIGPGGSTQTGYFKVMLVQ